MKNFLETVQSYARSLFINGFLALLPLVLTLAIFSITINLIKAWILTPVRAAISVTPLAAIPFIEVIITIIIILIFGTIVRFLILRSLLEAGEQLIVKIPFVRPIYSSAKQLVQIFSTSPEKSPTRKVVLVPYQSTGSYTIGFMTSELPAKLSPQESAQYCTIFIPTTPNPTSGYLIIVPAVDVKPIDLSAQEAMTLIVSGGIVYPERFTMGKR